MVSRFGLLAVLEVIENAAGYGYPISLNVFLSSQPPPTLILFNVRNSSYDRPCSVAGSLSNLGNSRKDISHWQSFVHSARGSGAELVSK